MNRLTIAVLLASIVMAVVTGCGSSATPQSGPDEDVIIRLHEDLLRAHLENDLESWLAAESEDYIMVNRGEISYPTKKERAARLQPYLDRTTFTEYRDLIPPVVRTSPDGMTAWLVAQVKISGSQTTGAGDDVPFDWTWAWIELYEKRKGRWLRVGNVSNQKRSGSRMAE
jgi:hypothetical protein